MAKFLKGNELNAELEKIFESADSSIILISPYIKLHDRYKSALLTKLQEHHIKIIVLFGKNEDDMSKSMKEEDFLFFKQFPNIEILHEKRLHAKYYANESKGILTSMNLYGYSQNNNIETGVLMERTLKGAFTGGNNLEIESWEYFDTVLDQADLLFEKQPVYEKKNLLGFKKYTISEVVKDELSDFFNNKNYKKVDKKTRSKSDSKTRETISTKDTGYCIRTGIEIPFNPKRPFSDKAFETWNRFKDEDYSEKFCHFSGEESNGETSFAKPILRKNWKKSKGK